MVGVATGVPASLVTVNTSDSGSITIDKFIDMANYLLEMDEPPLVFSTSYGFNEPANNTGFTQLATCVSCIALGSRPDTVSSSVPCATRMRSSVRAECLSSTQPVTAALRALS